MLKFLVSALSISSAVALEHHSPFFTLRSPEQMNRGKDRVMLSPPPVDPAPPRPPPPHGDPVPHRRSPPAPSLEDVLGRMEATRNDRVRALHGFGHHDDDHHDRHDDDHHDEHHMMLPAPPKPKPNPLAFSKPPPKPVSGMKPPTKPVSGIKPPPKPKAGPGPVPGPIPGHLPVSKPPPRMEVASPTSKPVSRYSSRDSLDMATDKAFDQCQFDYARLCSQRSVGSSGVRMGGNSQDVMFVDFMSVAFPTSDVEPCDKMTQLIDDADDDSMDDDYADDDADDDSMDDDADEVEVLFLSNPNPIFDIMQSFLSSFSRPIPPSSDAIPISSPPRPAFRMLQSRDEFDDMMIGFGMDGDMCLLDNYNHLSSSCQASLDQLQMEIDEYDFDDGDGCPLVPIILFCLVMMLVLRCLARRRMAKRMDTLQTTLTAIHANPELKEKVEAASGVPLPPPLPKCRIAEKPWYVKVCCLLGVMAAVVVSAVSGLVITHAILSSGEDEDDNVEVSQSPIVVFLVLFVVVWAQFLVVVGILKAISAYRNASSAPVTASTGTSNNSSNNQSSGGNYPQVLQRMRSIQISSLLPRFGRPSSSSQRPEYEPLLSSDENDESTSTEMVDASAPPAVTHIPVVVTPVQYVSPNVQSSISML